MRLHRLRNLMSIGVASSALLLFGIAAAGCAEDDPLEDAAEEAGDAIDEVGDEIEEATDG